MKRLNILVWLLVVDIMFTAITYYITGNMEWEVNPLVQREYIPHLIICQILAFWAATANEFGFVMHLGLRAGAIASHVYSWISLSRGISMEEQIMKAAQSGYLYTGTAMSAFLQFVLLSVVIILWKPLRIPYRLERGLGYVIDKLPR